mgnify:CR=1 FL=1
MKNIQKTVITALVILFNLILSQYSNAHIMVAQHGTLNIVDDGAFMVMSLPVSAFEGIDDDKDGKLSMAEFNLHRSAIVNIVQEKVVLKDNNGKITLQGIMLSPVTSHHSPKEPTSQLIVMGRFTLTEPNSALQYQINLFGKTPTEQLLEITATRKNGSNKQVAKLSPNKSSVTFFEK